MKPAASLPASICYQGCHSAVAWAGRVVADPAAFKAFLVDPVKPRVRDDEAGDPFATELLGLATTGMATDFLKKLLRSVPEVQDWEIGESLAECLLQQDASRAVHWPWNNARDRRAPRASLPGADLVGFCREQDVVLLLLGEVKTSSDVNAPPKVMYGGSGMTWQLEEHATRLDIQHTLLKWLRTRCSTREQLELYQAATRRYLESDGRAILLIGILLRDTPPNERDLRSRALHLAAKLLAPTKIELVAWYLPVPIHDWPALLDGGTP